MQKKINGEERVLQYMRETGYITSWRAIAEFGITRLSAVIYRLRKRGYNIQTETVTGKNRYNDIISYAKYTIDEQN